jgi:hypothetical protein
LQFPGMCDIGVRCCWCIPLMRTRKHPCVIIRPDWGQIDSTLKKPGCPLLLVLIWMEQISNWQHASNLIGYWNVERDIYWRETQIGLRLISEIPMQLLYFAFLC